MGVYFHPYKPGTQINGPLFWPWNFGLVLGGLGPFKTRGHLGSRKLNLPKLDK